jgi:hypothetical protein
MKEWHFFDKVYRIWVVVVISSPGEFKDFMDAACYKHVDDIEEDLSSGYCVNLNASNTTNGNYATIVWLRRKEIGCLVHELSHLVMFILSDKGVPIAIENTEAFAYYQEYWFNEITRAWRKHPTGISSKDVIK